VVGPRAEREAVRVVREEAGFSERGAYGLIGMHRGSWRYRRRERNEAVLRARLRELAAERSRFGNRRLHIFLRREKAGDGTLRKSYEAEHYQSNHVQGGTVMSASPGTGVVNPYLQHWRYSNLLILGAATFPKQGSSNPTLTLRAMTYRTEAAIIDRYQKKEGPLT
jgi:choline dehydrogenase-like flavoprotein